MAQLESLFAKAHDKTIRYSEDNIEDDIMGTTLSVLVIRDDSVLITHVGDSRIYLLRDGELIQITEDDTGVQLLVEGGKLTPEEAGYAC